MSNQVLLIMMGVTAGLFFLIIVAYYFISKKMKKSEYKKIQKLQEGTKASIFSAEILFQRLYMFYMKVPLIKRYILKLRRKLEIINVEDEYKTRRDSAKILTKALAIILPLTVVTIALTYTNYLLMTIILLFELLMIDILIDGSVDKKDNKLLREQLEFFSEIRHAYNEFNMVEEAIYQVSQDDERDVSRQGERIYEILISDDPETELEKYYDIAPNIYLKEFAGLSYLTKEFGDRKVDGASLFLKNINNITQEMQLEILKRDKLDYVFKSLAVIAVAPILILEPLRKWSISNFEFTTSWYNGKSGAMMQILIMIIAVVSYVLVRKLKDNNGGSDTRTVETSWQKRILKNKIINKVVYLFIPKKGTKDYKKVQKLLKDSASSLKMDWLYVNKIFSAIAAFIVSIFLFTYIHDVAIEYVYTEATAEYSITGSLSEADEAKAMVLTEQDNIFLEMFKGKISTSEDDIKFALQNSTYYEESTEDEVTEAVERIYAKLIIVNAEYLKWFEILLAFVFAIIGYNSQVWILKFQKKMREIEMEDEVMQFQTIILMLMRIERVNVEIILEWMERYANIFKAPITKCVNNYEAGAWEALDKMKDEVSFLQFIRLIEGLQAAVEKIPIIDAFDELDTEKDYYQERRKEANERLIKRKELIGKVIGFAPLVMVFVGYLIVPLVFIGLTSMSETFTSMMSI